MQAQKWKKPLKDTGKRSTETALNTLLLFIRRQSGSLEKFLSFWHTSKHEELSSFIEEIIKNEMTIQEKEIREQTIEEVLEIIQREYEWKVGTNLVGL